MILDAGTEELAHVEMLATMVARLLEGASAEQQESAAAGSSVVGAILGGTDPKDMLMAATMSPQHLIVSGTGASTPGGICWLISGRISIPSLKDTFRPFGSTNCPWTLESVTCCRS